ncbi:class I SAM-dependent methyltransferase [Thioalkalivibrio sulfidiphilus]|nr:class I SAM-dependent methyltransferase [Thioalkalivibrio sulfidiphilus]
MNYSEVFNHRGQPYDMAMQLQPMARSQEFIQVIERAALLPGKRVADIPAGGGYLSDFLPSDCSWHGHEPSIGFTGNMINHGAEIQGADLLPLPWADDSMDVAISLAGLHHLQDKSALFADVRRVVRPGGRFVISDVEAHSPQAIFLDGYVNANNSTGHHGIFLDKSTEEDLASNGWACLSSEYVPFHWIFDDLECMGTFCRLLFDLRSDNLWGTVKAIETQLGVDDLENWKVGMRWGLRTIVVE